jgi:hypothetical protein
MNSKHMCISANAAITITMKTQEFSILYLEKDKHARTIISQKSYGKQKKNIVVK